MFNDQLLEIHEDSTLQSSSMRVPVNRYRYFVERTPGSIRVILSKALGEHLIEVSSDIYQQIDDKHKSGPGVGMPR